MLGAPSVAPSTPPSLVSASIVTTSLDASVAESSATASLASPPPASPAPASGIGASTHSIAGSVFAGTGTHIPGVPPARLHVSQRPWQGLPQHTPSVQLPEPHSLS